MLGVFAGVADVLASEPLDDPLSELVDPELAPSAEEAAVFSVVDGVVEVDLPRLSFL